MLLRKFLFALIKSCKWQWFLIDQNIIWEYTSSTEISGEILNWLSEQKINLEVKVDGSETDSWPDTEHQRPTILFCHTFKVWQNLKIFLSQGNAE